MDSQSEEIILRLVQRSTSQDEEHIRSLTKQSDSMARDTLATGKIDLKLNKGKTCQVSQRDDQNGIFTLLV